MKTALRVVVVLMVLAALGSSILAQSEANEVKGTGTPGQIPLWTHPHRQGDSVITQNSDGSLNVSLSSYLALFASTNDASNGSTALQGSHTATTGLTSGVQGFDASPNGVGVQGINTGGDGGWGVKGSSNSPDSVGVEGFSPNVGVRGQSLICNSGGCTFQSGTAGQFIVGSGGNLLVGFVGSGSTWTPVFRVDSTGQGFFDGGTQTSGADFAESVAVARGPHPYEPGDLLVLDATANRQIKLSSEPYSTLVAGIYSTKPGILATTHKLDSPATDGEVPLAIVGIVPCKVSAENGPIHRGDLLVTSSTPGYAMKGTDRSRMLGAVVGKAMEPLATGTGEIQVLVTLQ